MSIHGDASLWSDLFPDKLIPSILELVIKSWRKFAKPQPSDHEEPITRRFRETLIKEKAKKDLPFTIWPESSETDPITGKEIGRIDLRFLPGFKERIYFAFECKRLRYPSKTGIISNANKYVAQEGMLRFISEKYSKDLSNGGMIGYVMDGKESLAISSIKKSIDKNQKSLNLCPNSSLDACSLFPKENHIKETKHYIDRDFTIYHVFLAV